MSKLPNFELFISVRNLKPKLKWFIMPKMSSQKSEAKISPIELPPWGPSEL